MESEHKACVWYAFFVTIVVIAAICGLTEGCNKAHETEKEAFKQGYIQKATYGGIIWFKKGEKAEQE